MSKTFRNYNLREFSETFDKSNTVAPEELQRRVVWGTREKQSYLKSVSQNRVWASPIIIADVRGCLNYCKKHGCAVDIEWFERWMERGVEYLILDGQNRFQSLQAFFNSEYQVSGVFVDQDSAKVSVENQFFKDLDTRLKDKFSTGSTINVAMIGNETRSGLQELFLDYNDGVSLNAMEKRDCSFSGIAKWVRQQAKKYENTIKRLYNPGQISRMSDREWIAQVAMHCMKEYRSLDYRPPSSHQDNEMDKWYNIGFDYLRLDDKGSPHTESELKRVEKILKIVHDVIENQKAVQTRSGSFSYQMAWAIVLAAEWICDNGYYVRDHDVFYKKLSEIDKKLVAESSSEYGADFDRYLAQMHSGAESVEPSKSQYYFHWANNHKARSARDKRFNNPAGLLQEMLKNDHDLSIRKMA